MKLIFESNAKKGYNDCWKYEIVTIKVEQHSNNINPKQHVIELSKDKEIIVVVDFLVYSIYMNNKKIEKNKSKEEGLENIENGLW